jgi:hypothetical protein
MLATVFRLLFAKESAAETQDSNWVAVERGPSCGSPSLVSDFVQVSNMGTTGRGTAELRRGVHPWG